MIPLDAIRPAEDAARLGLPALFPADPIGRPRRCRLQALGWQEVEIRFPVYKGYFLKNRKIAVPYHGRYKTSQHRHFRAY